MEKLPKKLRKNELRGSSYFAPFFDNIGKERDQKHALNDAHGRLGALEFGLPIPCFSNTKIAINPFKIAGTRYNNF